jgi:outer membrane murein-binding lipoprotein Lpp
VSSFEDAIWTHLVDYHAADRVEFRAPTPPKRRVRPVAATAGGLVLAAAVVVVVLVLGASTTAPPAYALTRVAGGTYTVSLNDISTGIPALNAKFAQLGIRETAVPIKAGCTASSFDPVQAAPGALTQTVTVSDREIPAGTRGFIAAEPGPDGHVLLAQGTTAQPIPSCFPTTTSSGIPGP